MKIKKQAVAKQALPRYPKQSPNEDLRLQMAPIDESAAEQDFQRLQKILQRRSNSRSYVKDVLATKPEAVSFVQPIKEFKLVGAKPFQKVGNLGQSASVN